MSEFFFFFDRRWDWFFLGEGGDCGEFLLFHFFVTNFRRFMILTPFFYFKKNKDKLIKSRIFFKIKKY